jgi:fructokinase
MLAGIEAGGTKMVVAIAPSPSEIIAQAEIPTTDPETTDAALKCALRKMVETTGSSITALGIASFGPVQINEGAAEYGQILSTPKPGWSNFSFLKRFEYLNVPIRVDTDVNAAALAESAVGAGKSANTVAYVTVGTGIGVGIVSNGRALAGFGHYEIGHIFPPRHENDLLVGICPFHKDCLEGLASGPAIKQRWGADLSSIGKNPDAIEIQAHYLAHLAHTLLLTHTPEKIIFGGGVMKAEGLIEAVRAQTQDLLNGYLIHDCIEEGMDRFICRPGLNNNSGITGALMLAERALK